MIEKLDWSHGNILAYEVSGQVTEDEIQQAHDEVDHLVREFGTLNLLVRLPEMPGMEASAVNDRLRFTKEHYDNIDKYAIVGDSRAVEWISKAADAVTKTEIKHFDLDDEESAKAWLDHTV
ncbi:SpoIIAA-like protein [Salsuginibacillus halophilus]|uniref:SpoIIAA-like protein n=1 Tax=Salsuginibacillus halophilus TaxID=517424 RepID=A0A2P8HI78_9BACI|nr:STAS/SEC14 domain-containing protein [Salsuginibacillus halophilus]PSL45918.1 SpoIIAA-like protein [Salsuginibacillus halophilus]